MEYFFSDLSDKSETGNGYPTCPRGWMGSVAMDSGVRNLNSDSSNNVSEMMNFDAYAGWCNNPSLLSELVFPSFVLPSPTVSASNFSSFDGLGFMDQYDSEISKEDNNMNTQLLFPMNSIDESVDLIDRRDESLIPMSPVQSLADRMLRALNLFKEWSGGGILAQVWVPSKNGDQDVLSTCEQPYLLDQTLSGFREVSRSFTFDMEVKPGSFLGLPGRVFTSKIPEWTSNVMYYNKAEYLRVQHALDHKVRGSIAVPVFDDKDDLPGRCCAVLELVTSKDKTNFDLEMESVCSALQAVNLRSSVPPRLIPQSLSLNQRAALDEISDVLRTICHVHQLPLALTWIPCSYIEGSDDETIPIHSRGYDTSSNEKCVLCVEVDACYVKDNDMQDFVHACVEHYLEEGQGVVGKALQSNYPYFYSDVKEYHISEYPLVHHARKFGLNAAVGIRLRSIYTGDDDYILEFFLPVGVKGIAEQQLLLGDISSTMQQICKSLRTVSDDEFLGIKGFEVELHDEEVETSIATELCRSSSEQSFVTINLNSAGDVSRDISEQKAMQMESDAPSGQALVGSVKQIEKKRSTAEKHISLNVLQKYFSGSLKDAATSLGVCPTTLKRICRQHGISRWPSRKINKVNRSLRKILTVLDSVHGVEDVLKFNPVMGELVSAGYPIQESYAKENPPSTNKNSLKKSESFTRNAKSDMTIVKTEEYPELDGSYVTRVNQKSRMIGFESNRHMSSSFEKVCEKDTCFKSDGIVMDIGHQPTSSGITDSSNGSHSLKNNILSSPGEIHHPKPERQNGDNNIGFKITVKATYNDDTIRFKFDPADGCGQLCEEVAKRFKLEIGQFQLKYLDDEDEWVMLVNDSDLDECIRVLEFLGTRSVKFLVRDVPSFMGSSDSSNCFL